MPMHVSLPWPWGGGGRGVLGYWGRGGGGGTGAFGDRAGGTLRAGPKRLVIGIASKGPFGHLVTPADKGPQKWSRHGSLPQVGEGTGVSWAYATVPVQAFFLSCEIFF